MGDQIALQNTKIFLGALLYGQLCPGIATASPHCIDEVEPYRSLVVHGGSGAANPLLIQLPDGSAHQVTDESVPLDDPFWEHFAIDRTILRIAETDPTLSEEATPEEINERVMQLTASFLDSQQAEPIFLPDEDGFQVDGFASSSGFSDGTPLDLLGALDTGALDLRPVALFNRVDLISDSGLTCGEQRIVYASTSNSSALMIFEAGLANPHPELGRRGCLPLIRHWLEAADLPVAERGEHLAALFYDGIDEFSSAIHFDNLGGIRGQVRGNARRAWTPEWSLREWRVGLAAQTGALELAPVTVKDNAFAELLNAELDTAAPETTGMSDSEWTQLQEAFLDHWTHDLVPNLLTPETESLSGGEDNGVPFINAIRAGVDDGFNEFQSVSEPVEATANTVSNDLLDAIMEVGENSEIQVVNRYVFGATCAGCHMTPGLFSSREVAPGIAWPLSGSFVHVSATGDLSQALHGTFLPGRKTQVFERLAEASPADGNLDGVVGVQDLLLVLAGWGTEQASGDFNCNGTIEVMDLVLVLSEWTPTPPERLASGEEELKSLEEAVRTASGKHRQKALVELISAQDAIRAMEEAEPGPTGLPRRSH